MTPEEFYEQFNPTCNTPSWHDFSLKFAAAYAKHVTADLAGAAPSEGGGQV